jgi:hypothetical protein
MPARAKVALLKFGDPAGSGARHYYGRYYWSDESYLKLQQGYTDTLSAALAQSEFIHEVTPLPSLMTPRNASIPVLREAAVRMQADLLLVFRINSDIYSRYRMFSKDTVKAFSTCELVLIDIRTGLVPFTKVVTRERLETKQEGDLELSETMRRAEGMAANDALQAAAGELTAFLKAVPKKGG